MSGLETAVAFGVLICGAGGPRLPVRVRTQTGAARPAAPQGITADADSPPFNSEVYQIPWGSHGLWPEQLFWEHTDKVKNKRGAQAAAAGLEKMRIVPVLSAIMWQQEFERARPGGANAEKPGYRQWGEWVEKHKHLLPVDANGEPWHHEHGHISVTMPFDEEDWPEGIKDAVYADWAAVRIGALCEATGSRGIFAADFIEGIPHATTKEIDFHPRILDAFGKWARIRIPGATVRERAQYIRKNCFPLWNDYWCHGYGYWYGAMAREIRRRTGREPLMGFQTHYYPSRRRRHGTDFRIYLEHVDSPQNMLSNIELQSDALRNVEPAYADSVVFGCFACREPDFICGGHMDSDHEAFWAAVKNTRQGWSEEDRREWGFKFLKANWLEVGWTHVANRDGTVRRAAQLLLRSYWDAGKVDEKLAELMRSVRPARPFGPAAYYSVSVERQFEARGQDWQFHRRLVAHRARGCALGYYVSDVALEELRRESFPTAWVAPDHGMIPPREKARLLRIAPLVEPGSRVASPVTFSEDVGGFAFIDRNDQLIVLAGRIGLGREDVRATVTVRGLPDGRYRAVNLLRLVEGGTEGETQKEAYDFAVSGRQGAFSFPLERWDTKAFGIPGVLRERPRPVSKAAKPGPPTEEKRPEPAERREPPRRAAGEAPAVRGGPEPEEPERPVVPPELLRLYKEAETCFIDGEFDKAKELFEEIVREHPETEQAKMGKEYLRIIE